MYPSRESRYRNVVTTPTYSDQRRGGPRGIFLVAGIGILLLCCACSGLFIGGWLFQQANANGTPPAFPNPFGGAADKPTPTLDRTAPVAVRTPNLNESGIEATVLTMQRPLKVEGSVKLPPNEQFILVTVRLTNTKKTGNIQVNSSEFKVIGDGGLTYTPNPKTVTIPNQLTQVAVAPGKSVDVELIFQIATDDTSLRLNWTVGKTTRVYMLEKQK